ncbi:MAG: hypothetical protein ACFCVA_14290 [Gammaproteobacteria bacterium]
MKSVAIVLIVCGLLLGPAYYVFYRYFSGDVVMVLPVAVQDRPTAGVQSHAPAIAPRAFEPVVLRLDPEMNPVRLTLKLRGHWNTFLVEPGHNRHRATLTGEGGVIADSVFQISATGPEPGWQVYREVLATLEVPTSGDYTLVLKEVAQQNMVASDFVVEVRRNVHSPDTRIVVAGALMLCLGFIALLR